MSLPTPVITVVNMCVSLGVQSEKSHIEQHLAMEEEINKLKMQISELSTENQNLKMQK